MLSGQDGDQRRCVHALLFEPAPAWVVLGVRSELLSAISNLVSNAVRYTPAGGTIRVAWSRDAEQLTLSVSDTGPGIAPEHLPRLSERFYRVDRSRSRETGGTGLGLAIVKHVVQRHGAALKIDSVVGQGSRFAIVLPPVRVRKLELPLEGLMCIPPADEEPAPHFALLRTIAERNGLRGLSMGMSGDYGLAAAMGASYVRVGSAIFGEREKA